MFISCIALCVVLPFTFAIEVSTSLGVIRGVKLKSRLDEDFFAFRGIRYAKSPVNDLRFKAPQPVEPWKPDIFDATDDGPRCPQIPLNLTDSSEDCLRLNIYSKDLNGSRPVIIFIHPGAYYIFSAQSKNYAGPEILMDRDIVLVTFNYRLGTLGFLATGTEHAPGNAGLKDQVLAFKWVRDHIQNFGGDPNSVTLLGYSAGSVSIGFHMVSPMSKGLFHRAIAMSGSPFSHTHEPFEDDQLEFAKLQAELVKCPTDSVKSMVDCLEKVPSEEFVRTFYDIFGRGLFWNPVVEKDFGQERFIIEDPLASLKAGRFHKIPLISGITKDEFMKISFDILNDATLTKKFNDDWHLMAPIYFHYQQNTTRSRKISDVLKKEYLNNQPLNSSGPIEPLGRLYSDAVIGFPTHRFSHLVSRFVPVYYYCFSYKGRFSDFLYPGNTPYGSVHHDDLQYLLRNSLVSPMFKRTDPEDAVIERLTRMWTNFAETGDPNNEDDKYLKNINWKPLNLSKENYLDIGDELLMKRGLFLERFNIWERLFPLD